MQHVHGQNMYVLDEGTGSWDGKTIINPQNPQRRDTQTLRPNGYLVVLLKSDNPGPWPFHCHIAWHVSQGLYINVLQKPDSVNQTQIPGVLGQTCDGEFFADLFADGETDAVGTQRGTSTRRATPWTRLIPACDVPVESQPSATSCFPSALLSCSSPRAP